MNSQPCEEEGRKLRMKAKKKTKDFPRHHIAYTPLPQPLPICMQVYGEREWLVPSGPADGQESYFKWPLFISLSQSLLLSAYFKNPHKGITPNLVQASLLSFFLETGLLAFYIIECSLPSLQKDAALVIPEDTDSPRGSQLLAVQVHRRNPLFAGFIWN